MAALVLQKILNIHYISGTESQQELLSNILNSFHTCAEEAKTDKPLYVQGQKYSL